jgi:hypothetical protein
VERDQRERWFRAHVEHFDPDGAGMTSDERVDLTAWRRWTHVELATSTKTLVPRDLAARVDTLISYGPPPTPITICA